MTWYQKIRERYSERITIKLYFLRNKRKFSRFIFLFWKFLGVFTLIILFVACSVKEPEPTPIVEVVETSTPTPLPAPTATATQTAILTHTPTPSDTPTPTITEEEIIEDIFKSYQEAVRERNYEVAIALLDDSVFDFYNEARIRAQRLSPANIKEVPMPISDKATIYWLRHMLTFSELEEMTPEEILIFALDHEWIGSSAANVKLKKGSIFRPGRIGSIEIVSRPEDSFVRFSNNDGIWTFNLLKPMILHDWDIVLDTLFEESGLSEEMFFSRLLKEMTGKDVDEAIFKGPLPEPTEPN